MDKCTYQIGGNHKKFLFFPYKLIIFNGYNTVENLCNKKTERVN